MSVFYCSGCERKHESDGYIRHMAHPLTKKQGWFCSQWFRPSKPPEFVPQSIKEQRREHHDALLQPYREGNFSKEYRDAYPEISRNMVKSGVITQQQHDKAKPVWHGDEL